MTEKEFCEIETLYSGEPIDKIGQLQKATFTGQELKEYIEFAIKHLERNKRSIKFKTLCWNEFSIKFYKEGIIIRFFKKAAIITF